MSSVAAENSLSSTTFFQSLADAEHRVLFLDYDGTLAPFVADRRHAQPYPGLVHLIAEVSSCGTRVVIASGRMAQEVRDLIGLAPPLEIWGSHGFERLFPNDECRTGECDRRLAAALDRAHESLVAEGVGEMVERKPCGIAIHWRGLSDGHAREVAVVSQRVLSRAAEFGASLSAFDGGLELRVRGYDKARVVATVLAECSGHTVAAFLGDDATDEDGFRAVQSNGVGILVRPEWRTTSAEMWLRPPGEVAEFFKQWIAICGGRP